MTGQTSAFGLDIDPRSVHLVRVVRRLGRVVVTHTSSALLPPEGGQGHESVIRRTVEALGLTGERCGVAIYGRGVILNTLSVPPPARSREQVAEAEIKRLGFLSEEPMVTDFSADPNDTEHTTVLIAMAQGQAVADTLVVPDHTGLQVTRLLPIPVAMLRALQKTATANTPQVMAHIRAESTHVIVGGRMGLLFSRRFEIGSSHFIDAIRTATGLRADAAEEARLRVGFGDRISTSSTDASVQASMRQTANAWADELQSTLTLWRERNIERSLDDQPVIVSGADTGANGFLEYIGTRLNRRIMAPHFDISGMPATNEPASTVALGLALAALDESDRSINLLPPNRRLALRLWLRRRLWLCMASVLAVTLILVLTAAFSRHQAISRALLIANAELQALQAMEQEQDRLHDDNNSLSTRLSQASLGTDTSHRIQSLLHALGKAKHEDDWVTVIADAATYFSGMSESENTEAAPLSTLIIEGYTPRKDFSTVLTMIERLRHEPSVAHADLVTDDRIPPALARREMWAAMDVVLFVIEIQLQP